MDHVMVLARLQCDELLELTQGKARMLRGIVVAAFVGIALGGSRQKMDCAHLGADQSLDMAAAMGRARRAPDDVDSFVSACAYEGFEPRKSAPLSV